MRFRPCIDIHDGKVKQIVGSSLTDEGAEENFVSSQEAQFYASLYQRDGLRGGHVILLNPAGTAEYARDAVQAERALQAYPGGLQVGGGIDPENASYFLERGASHVIVTSYVFQDGKIKYSHLEKLKERVGKERLVLDLSCRRLGGEYYIVTDRWQRFTEEPLTEQLFKELASYCDEFLIHAVDAEGKSGGIETGLVCLLGEWAALPVTYAGGVGSLADLELLRRLGRERLDVTIGSALDLFGGNISYGEVVRKYGK